MGVRDIGIQTDIEATGNEDLGIYGPLASQTKLYLTLPTGPFAGQRVAFQFTPTPETVGALTFYRPAWTALTPGDGQTLNHAFR